MDTGYTNFRRDRAEREGGGVLIALKDNLDCLRRSDLETGLEMLCVELNLACSSKIVISAIYGPPDSTSSYGPVHTKTIVNANFFMRLGLPSTRRR